MLEALSSLPRYSRGLGHECAIKNAWQGLQIVRPSEGNQKFSAVFPKSSFLDKEPGQKPTK
jgi:hypothetical protein